ncbi:MAG: branched-chain-amino-acid transaminase [Spirochaetales bacterium]|nr:branched-chain-amino-acid transaminase [Spirochaetales bacterium]
MAVFWMDGKFVQPEEAKVSVYDHGLLYGDGVFEGIRVYKGKAFRLDDHLERLSDGARALLIDVPYTREELKAAVTEACARRPHEDGYIRLVVTRGAGDLGLNPRLCARATVFLILDKIQLYPAQTYTDGIPLITASTRRVPLVCLDPRIKTLNYLNNIQAKQEALMAGKLEALLLNTDGLVAECTADNIFLVKKGRLITPDTIYGALDGITRRVVLELARQMELPVTVGAVALTDLYNADEAFMTGSGAEIVPVIELDGRKIGSGKPGPVTQRLIQAFHQATL